MQKISPEMLLKVGTGDLVYSRESFHFSYDSIKVNEVVIPCLAVTGDDIHARIPISAIDYYELRKEDSELAE